MPISSKFVVSDEIAGKLSVKHIYEIAKVKSKDKCLVGVPLQVRMLFVCVRRCLAGFLCIRDRLLPIPLEFLVPQIRKNIFASNGELNMKCYGWGSILVCFSLLSYQSTETFRFT